MDEKLLKQEHEMLQNHIAIILSQLQPHFLYNALVLIQQYCRTSPKIAEETVVEFSNYLRGNLDSLVINGLITFERELHHVKNYLSIEKKRFEERLNIAYEIKFKDFLLPPMALQAIVENAVRHGVTKNENGGTVRIETSNIDGNVVITVTDDGVGFELSDEPEKHSYNQQRFNTPGGIKNVRSRLAVMCGGSLEIKSTPDAGTKVIITIPANTNGK
jgi:LytS/YehU family sensor histidine kinase